MLERESTKQRFIKLNMHSTAQQLPRFFLCFFWSLVVFYRRISAHVSFDAIALLHHLHQQDNIFQNSSTVLPSALHRRSPTRERPTTPSIHPSIHPCIRTSLCPIPENSHPIYPYNLPPFDKPVASLEK